MERRLRDGVAALLEVLVVVVKGCANKLLVSGVSLLLLLLEASIIIMVVERRGDEIVFCKRPNHIASRACVDDRRLASTFAAYFRWKQT
jgi:hypothetical protein